MSTARLSGRNQKRSAEAQGKPDSSLRSRRGGRCHSDPALREKNLLLVAAMPLRVLRDLSGKSFSPPRTRRARRTDPRRDSCSKGTKLLLTGELRRRSYGQGSPASCRAFTGYSTGTFALAIMRTGPSRPDSIKGSSLDQCFQVVNVMRPAGLGLFSSSHCG